MVRWSLKKPSTLVACTNWSDALAITKSRMEPLSWVAEVTSCESPKASIRSSSLRAVVSDGTWVRMPRLKSPTMRSFSFVSVACSRRDANSSRKLALEELGGRYTTRMRSEHGLSEIEQSSSSKVWKTGFAFRRTVIVVLKISARPPPLRDARGA